MPLRADPLAYEPVMSISRGLRGELGAVRVERSSCAPLDKLRGLTRGVEGDELMLVSMYTVDCGCICASRGVAGWVGWAVVSGELGVGGKTLERTLTVVYYAADKQGYGCSVDVAGAWGGGKAPGVKGGVWLYMLGGR
jgi:hypothetical protein